MTNIPELTVAVGIIKDQLGKVLVALRLPDTDQGGLWEFPGGKVNPGETILAALQREILEEIGIEILHATPLLTIRHAYSYKTVHLNVWTVDQFQGQPQGAEGQQIAWVAIDELSKLEFPAANAEIVKALKIKN